MNCYIVSIKYSPGLFKEFTTMGRKMEERGFSVRYLISKEYKWMVEGGKYDIVYVSSSKNIREMLIECVCYFFGMRRKLKNAFKNYSPDYVCVYNPHPLNASLLKVAKRIKSDGIRAVYLHEPGKPKTASYGFKGNLFFRIVDYCQKKAVLMTTDIILPSPFAIERFKEYFPDYSQRTHYAPILLSDNRVEYNQKRKYFTMIGRFNFSKRLDKFIELINYSAGKQNYEFQIVTASNIDSYISEISPQARKKVHIVKHDRITDKQISIALSQSIAVFCIHSNVTQSGVVPIAFMNSTPVIAHANRGFTQFLTHKENGWIISEDLTTTNMIKAVQAVKNNFAKLSANARQSYIDIFSENNWSKHYSWISDRLNQ